MSDHHFLLLASLVFAVSMAWLNLQITRDQILKRATHVLVWLSLLLATASLLYLALVTWR